MRIVATTLFILASLPAAHAAEDDLRFLFREDLKCEDVADSVRRLLCIVARDQKKNPAKPLDPDRMTDDQKAAVKRAISLSGLHCPVIVSSNKEGENVNGWIVRIRCASEDRTSRWDIKMTGFPARAPEFEPY